jgi:hypothetical protein
VMKYWSMVMTGRQVAVEVRAGNFS